MCSARDARADGIWATDWQSGSTTKKVVFVSLTSLAVVSLGGAAASNIQELVLTSRRNDMLLSYGNAPGTVGAQCFSGPQCTTLRDLNESIDGARSRWAPLAFTGGGLLLAAVGVLVFWPDKSPQTALRVVPMVGQQSGGVALGGRF